MNFFSKSAFRLAPTLMLGGVMVTFGVFVASYLGGPALGEDRGIHYLLNTELTHLTSLQDALSFRWQLSRPVSGIWMGLITYLSGNDLLLIRLANFLLFLTSILLFYQIPHNRTRPRLWALLCFLLMTHPVLFEVISCVSFVWEILGLFWTLLGIHVAFRWDHFKKATHASLLLVVFYFLATLSKEVYLLFFPLFLWATLPLGWYEVHCSKGQLKKYFLVTLLVLGGVTGLLLLSETRLPHGVHIGWSHLPFLTYLKTIPQAAVEVLLKFFHLLPLSTMRLLDRSLWLKDLSPLGVYVLVLLTLLVPVLLLRLTKAKPQIHRPHLVFWLVFFFYILIPNLNVGSEHYNLPVLALFILLVGNILEQGQFSSLFRKAVLIFLSFQIVGNIVILQMRFERSQNLMSFYSHELKQSSYSPQAWKALIHSFVLETKSQAFFDHFKTIKHNAPALHPILLSYEFFYLAKQENIEGAATLWRDLVALPVSEDPKLGLMKFLAHLQAAYPE